MSWLSSEIVGIIFYLLPGFIAAWVFHGFTGYQRSAPFERVVHALILTVIIQVMVFVARETLFVIGAKSAWGTWTEDVALAWSVGLAFIVGLGLAFGANNDLPHRWLRRDSPGLRLTTSTAQPSEWFGAFSANHGYVTLHFHDGRRLFGWPTEWPDLPDRGHFVMYWPAWLLDNGERIPLHGVRFILAPATSIRLVEFILEEDEIPVTKDELHRIKQKLVQLRQKGSDDAA